MATAHLESLAKSMFKKLNVNNAEDMIRVLVESQEAVIRTARLLYPLVNEANDEASADLITQRITSHEKTAWMLRSLLE